MSITPTRRCPQCRKLFPIGHYADVTGYRVVCRTCQRQRQTVWLRTADCLMPVQRLTATD